MSGARDREMEKWHAIADVPSGFPGSARALGDALWLDRRAWVHDGAGTVGPGRRDEEGGESRNLAASGGNPVRRADRWSGLMATGKRALRCRSALAKPMNDYTPVRP